METQQWNIGDATIIKLVEVEMKTPVEQWFAASMPAADMRDVNAIPWARPTWIDDNGMMTGSMHSFLVELDGKRFVVDTGIGDDKERAADMFRLSGTGYLDRLEQAGWTRESVDGVICTHLHVDHVGWNTTLEAGAWVPTFPNARYYFVRDEFEHWKAFADNPHADDVYETDWARDMVDGKAVYNDSVRPIDKAGLVTLVDADAEIVPGLRFQPTPGHTPGHACVVVESGDDRAVITGDLMHTAFQIAHPEWSSLLDTDLVESAVTRTRMVKEWSDSGTLVLGTHFATPTGGYVVRDGDDWVFTQTRPQ